MTPKTQKWLCIPKLPDALPQGTLALPLTMVTWGYPASFQLFPREVL